MKRWMLWIAMALVVGGLAGCTAPPQGVGEKSSPTAPATATPTPPTTGTLTQPTSATQTQTAAAAAAQATAVVETSNVSYNPAQDPLVNPPVIFNPFPKDNPGEADQEDTLILNLQGNPTNLNPIFFSSMQDMQATDQLYTGLFTMDEKMNWMVNPDAAASFEEAPDHLSATVKIKPGLTWHDGQPWNAEDVRFSWQAIMDDRVPAPAVKTGVDQLADVQVVDPLTVHFVYKEVLATNKWNIAFPIIPRHIYDNPAERQKDPSLSTSDYYNRFNRQEVVGSGPYRLVSWISNDRLVLDRWDGYTGRKGHYKQIIFKIQPDPNTTLLLFKQGGLDFIDRLTGQQFATQTNDQDFADHGYKAMGTEWSYAYLGWNMDGSNPFFTDKRVRHALASAMNVPEIVEKVSYNLVTPCVGIFHPDSWMFNPDIQPIRFDLVKAAQLLDEAGWKVNPDDGWRYKTIDGKPVKFEFELLIPEGAATSVKIAAFYAANLKKIGVSLTTRLIEWAAFQQQTHNHNFQAEIAAWGSGSDPDGEWNLWRTEEYKGGRNYGGYSNPQVDQLLADGRRELDPARRAKIYQQIDKLIYDDQPYLFLTNPRTLAALAKRLRGMTFSPAGMIGYDPGLNGWWTPNRIAMPQ